MSSLTDLLKGQTVETKELGKLVKIETGRLNANAATADGEYKFFTTSDTVYRTDTYRWDTEALMVAGNADVGAVKYYKGKFNAYQRTYVLTDFGNEVLPMYLYYVIKSKLKPYLDNRKNNSAMVYIVLGTLKGFPVPIPPIEVQKEIVRILDTFTTLQAELTAELTGRRQQYEHYRDELLTFGDDVQVVQLSDIAQYSKDRIEASEVDKNTYVGVDNLLQEKRGKTISSYVPTGGRLTKYHVNDILIGNIRPYLRKIWFSNNEGGTNGDVLVIEVKSNLILPKFLFTVLSSEWFFFYNIQNSRGAKMPRGDKKAIMRFPIPIPSLEEQQRIVDILDRFDVLCNDISIGLPAEIEARQKQYEYYRDYIFNLVADQATQV